VSRVPGMAPRRLAVATVVALGWIGLACPGGSDRDARRKPISDSSADGSGSAADAHGAGAERRRAPLAIYAYRPGQGVERLSPDAVEGRPASFRYPAVHPDGDEAVFCGGADWPPRIWRTRLGAGTAEAITPPELAALFPGYSADGRKLVFSARNAEPVARPWEAVWEDGGAAAPSHIYVMNRDGSGLVEVTHGRHQDFRPALSPDGSVVVFSSRRPQQGLWAAPTDGRGEPRFLVGAALRPWFHPDGQRIFFHRGGEIYSIPKDGGEAVPFERGGPFRGESHGVFVDYDGRGLLFHSTRYSEFDIGRRAATRIWEQPFGGEARLVEVPGFVVVGHATRSRDGLLVFDTLERGRAGDAAEAPEAEGTP